MATTTTKKRTSHVHSVRSPDVIWNRAEKRAQAEDVVMNHVINELLEGYGRGMIDLPRVTKQYVRPAAPAAPASG